jgi:hypothetical protein
MSLTKMESSYATSEKLQSSIAVGTVERGRLSSKRLSCLGIVQFPRSGVDHMLYMANSTMENFKPFSGVSVVYSAFPPFFCGIGVTPLWLPVSPAANNLEPPLRWT